MDFRIPACALLGAMLLQPSAPTAAQTRPAPVDDARIDAALNALSFRNIGPATMSGRVDDLAVYERDPSLFYVGTSTGGLWKTTNNATTWEVLFDDRPDVVSIGAVALAQSDPDIVWVGTGESNNRQSSSWGNGVYMSSDGGHTWRHAGLADSRHIARIVIDPRDPEIVYVAALGHLWGPNETRGLYRTRDGGRTWDRVLFVDDDTGVTELVMDPRDPTVLYAATYQRRRSAWGFNGGGPGSGLYKSIDAGDSWKRLEGGLPKGPLGRIGIDVHAADPSVLFVTIEHASEGGIYRSADAGSTWMRVGNTNPRPMYFSKIRVDPRDERRIYLLGVPLMISDDGGRTFTASYSPHPDHHALWIDPRDPRHLIGGNDGGVAISHDRGRSWTAVVNMDLAQVYRVGFDMAEPYRVYAGLQDNMAWGGPSAVRSRLGIGNGDWFMVGEYDGFVTMADPGDDRIVYSEASGGRIFRVDRATNGRHLIQPEAPPGEPGLRWNWNAPFVMSAHDPATLLVAANRVLRSEDRGRSWRFVSPDLTSGADRDTLRLMGVPGAETTLSRNDGVSAYPTTTALAESPVRQGLWYTGADDGAVHVSADAGRSWLDLSGRFPGLPPRTQVADIVASRFSAARAYIAFDGHRGDDYSPRVYRTDDGGESWLPIVGGLPEGHVARSLAEDLENPDLLFLGTEFGLFTSIDRGARWHRLRADLPTVPIHDIEIHPRTNDLILGTHGRGIWILDDLTPLRQLDVAVRNPAHLFAIRAGARIVPAEDRHFWGEQRFFGENPPFGTPIRYFVGKAARQVVLEVRNTSGRVVRSWDDRELAAAAETGLHRIDWDLRYQPLAKPLIRVSPVSVLFSGSGVSGPFVPPGDYVVTLLVDGAAPVSRTVRVSADPRSPHSTADLEQADAARFALYEMHRALIESEEALGDLAARLASLRADTGSALAEIDSLARRADARLASAASVVGVAYGRPAAPRERDDLRTRVGDLEAQLLRSAAPPTEGQAATIARDHGALTDAVGLINTVIRDDLPRILLGRGLPQEPEIDVILPPARASR